MPHGTLEITFINRLIKVVRVELPPVEYDAKFDDYNFWISAVNLCPIVARMSYQEQGLEEYYLSLKM